VEEVRDEPLYRDRVCGTGIGKAGMVATIRVPSEKDPARRMAETRAFVTTKRGVLALADWLRCWQVPAVAMEATGDYWKPVFCRLEAEGSGCVLADARQIKNLPGRPKRDCLDSAWIAVCLQRGSITSCFVPTEEFRLIRLHTRCRRDLTGDRTRDKNRAGEAAGIGRYQDLGGAAGVHGMTGRDIMGQLIAGQRDPKVLAQLARNRARAKISQPEQALEGADFFTGAHAGLLKAMASASTGLMRRSPACRR
jgi:transposase